MRAGRYSSMDEKYPALQELSKTGKAYESY